MIAVVACILVAWIVFLRVNKNVENGLFDKKKDKKKDEPPAPVKPAAPNVSLASKAAPVKPAAPNVSLASKAAPVQPTTPILKCPGIYEKTTDVRFSSATLGGVGKSTVAKCRQMCDQVNGCKGFTFTNDKSSQCLLMSAFEQGMPYQGVDLYVKSAPL
jgi:CCR4-NOT transcriptional regulation complex NOT5 subunit